MKIDTAPYKQKLQDLGFSSENLDKAVEDISSMVLMKVISNLLSRLPEEKKKELASLSPADVSAYIETVSDITLSEEEFKNIETEVWSEYTQAIS